MENSLTHHGIKGMRWGVRRTAEQLDKAFGNKSVQRSLKKPTASIVKSVKKAKAKIREEERRKEIKGMSDDELRKKIDRLILERRYSELTSDNKKVSRGRQIVNDIIASSVRNVGTQVFTYALGTGVNKMAGKPIVNVKNDGKKKDKD